MPSPPPARPFIFDMGRYSFVDETKTLMARSFVVMSVLLCNHHGTYRSAAVVGGERKPNFSVGVMFGLVCTSGYAAVAASEIKDSESTTTSSSSTVKKCCDAAQAPTVSRVWRDTE